MSNGSHIATFIWGLVLTLIGAALAAVGFGWWDLAAFDLRYVAPVFVILIGAVIVIAALTQGSPRRGN